MIFISANCRSQAVGRANYLNSYFSTISKRLEPKGWGTRFPHNFRIYLKIYIQENFYQMK